MTTTYPITPKQLSFLYKLAGERIAPSLGTCGEERIENVGAYVENGQDAGTLTGNDVSRWIDFLLAQPKDSDEVPLPKTTNDTVTVTMPGVYEIDGQIYVVKPNREKTRLYAKRLVETASDRLNETGTRVQVDFEYAPGAIYRIRPEDKMPLEKAKELTIRYGRCIACNRKLKVAQSVEQGIGPVCITYFE